MTQTPEQIEYLMNSQGYIILGLPPESNAYQGYVEHYWQMGWDKDHVNFFWTGNGTDNVFGLQHKIDGLKTATHYAKTSMKLHPDWQIAMWDVRDEKLPVILDWDSWVKAQEFNPKTLSGVSNKFLARNFKFTIKEG